MFTADTNMLLYIPLLALMFATLNATPLDCPIGSSRSELAPSNPAETACPAYIVNNYTLTEYNIDENTTIGFSSQLDGHTGYCLQIPITGQSDPISGGTFNYTHHIYMILPIPWCYSSMSFAGSCGINGGVYPSYPDYFGPAIVMNERPLQQECLDYFSESFNPEFQPFPLWDANTDTLGTIRLAINDSCIFNSTFGSPYNKPLFRFFFLLFNGTYVLSNNSVFDLNQSQFINSSILYTNSAGNLLYSSFATTTNGPGGGRWCTDQCNTYPQPVCADSPRTYEKRETFRQRSIVSLACKDTTSGFGYVWRVENRYSFNIHFDWYILDIIQNVNLSVATNTTYINLTAVNSTLNIGFNNTLYNGFWPGVAGKRRVAALQYFYIPTYTPSTDANLSLSIGGKLRPTRLSLYAGLPNHYVGTTTLAGIVDFFDMRTTLNIKSFIEFNASIVGTPSPGRNATYLDKNITTTIRFDKDTMDLYVPKDYDRQIILTVCQRSTNTTATILEIINITGVSGWQALCDHINNESNTWPQTLVMLYDNFPGLLASNTSDPIPVCDCSNELRSPCTTGSSTTSTPGEVPDMMKLYSPGGISLVVNATVGPVCRITPELLANISKTISDPQMLILIYNATAISDGDYGYVWKIINNNVDPDVIIPGLTPLYINSNNDLYAKWAFGTYTPPSGNANLTYPIPYPYGTGGIVYYTSPQTNTTTWVKPQDVTIRSGTTYFFFSLASTPHKMFGTFQQICPYSDPGSAFLFCQGLFPSDPPTISSPYGWSVPADNTTLDALPNCTCGVDVPCELGRFLFNVDSDLNFSNLVIQPPPPLPPLQYAVLTSDCVPGVELCNGRDDNCNGLIDDIPGYSLPCGILQYDGIGICMNGNLGCPTNTTHPYLTFPAEIGTSYKPVCFGEIPPQEEICNLIDDNCDGIVDNITPEICGVSNIGTCQYGYTACSGGTLICVGNIDPIAEICGDGLDNDCDGTIDNGCPIITQVQSQAIMEQTNNLIDIKKYETQRKNRLFKKPISTTQMQIINTMDVLDIPSGGDTEEVTVLNVLNDISMYAITIYTSIWTIAILLCLLAVIVSLICLFGPHGGFCMWGSRFIRSS